MHRFFQEEHASFHAHGTFFGIWLLVMFVGVQILTKVRAILEPILWAFFLVMGLVPLTDVVECALRRVCCAPAAVIADGMRRTASTRQQCAPTRSSGQFDDHEEGLSDTTASGREASGRLPSPNGRNAPNSTPPPRIIVEEVYPTSDTGGETDEDVYNCRESGCMRTVAVMIVILFSVGFAVLFFIMVFKSAVHMQENWNHYQRGAQRITARTEAWMETLPDKVLQKITNKALEGMEQALSSLLGGFLEATTHTLVEMLWVFLYMIFWLCQPVHIGKDVSDVFRRYIFLKGLASAGYAFCIWILLHFLGVDLAIVFGLITFVFNFIPEVGPFIAMTLPLPVILFDDRLSNPLQFMVLALIGQLSLKFIFGNIVEIKLIESQQEMRMHPVVILFFVAFFQFIWGATGMLLSVPIVAALKATLHKIPPAYRNPILVFLEGDKAAPARWKQWRDSLGEPENPAALQTSAPSSSRNRK